MDITQLSLQSALVLAGLGLVIWFSRTWIKEWIAQSVRSDFEKELESFRSNLRDKEGEIVALRSSVLANVHASEEALIKRRIQAADDLWKAVTEIAPLGWTHMMATILSAEGMDEELKGNAKAREWAKAMLGPEKADSATIQDLGMSADSARPYVSDLTWALFSAYKTLYLWSWARARMMRSQNDEGLKLFQSNAFDEILIAAMPDQADYIRSNPTGAHYNLPNTLRERIIAQLRNLVGRGQDQENVTRAADLMKNLASINQTIAKAQTAAGTA